MWKDWDWLCTPYSQCGERKPLEYLYRLSLSKLKIYLIHVYVYLLVCIYKCFTYMYTSYIHKYTLSLVIKCIRHYMCYMCYVLIFFIPKHLVYKHYTHSTGPMFINVLRLYIHLKYTCNQSIIYKIWSNLIDMIYVYYTQSTCPIQGAPDTPKVRT